MIQEILQLVSIFNVADNSTNELDPGSEMSFCLAVEKTILELWLYLVDGYGTSSRCVG